LKQKLSMLTNIKKQREQLMKLNKAPDPSSLHEKPHF
jgi:hypothetical protein